MDRLVRVLLAVVLASTACTASVHPRAAAGQTPGPAATAPVEVAGVAATPGSVEAAIQTVIARGNAEQAQAIAAGDPTAMRDTSTDRYYQELVQTNQDLLDHGVVSIALLNLEWGPIELNRESATATTEETWRDISADGTINDSRDRNVYTLLRDGDGWRIDADDHPDETQPPSGAPPAEPAVPPTPEPREPSPPVPSGQNPSPNWSGYMAVGGTFTAVGATWTVPQPAADAAAGASAAWVGIGGVRTRDLIQAGTQEVVWSPGHVTYTTWIEMLPDPSQQVPLAAAPGDSVAVTIGQQSDGTWLVSLTNATTGQSYQQTVTYTSSLSSAEWIVEAPTVGRRGIVPVNDFGTVAFSGASAIENGQAVDLAQAGARPVTMIGAGRQALVVPSPLAPDGASFSAQRTTVPAAAQEPGAPATRRAGRR